MRKKARDVPLATWFSNSIWVLRMFVVVQVWVKVTPFLGSTYLASMSPLMVLDLASRVPWTLKATLLGALVWKRSEEKKRGQRSGGQVAQKKGGGLCSLHWRRDSLLIPLSFARTAAQPCADGNRRRDAPGTTACSGPSFAISSTRKASGRAIGRILWPRPLNTACGGNPVLSRSPHQMSTFERPAMFLLPLLQTRRNATITPGKQAQLLCMRIPG